MSAATTAPSAASGRADFWTMGAVGCAHFTSHVLQVALAPVLLFMTRDFGVSFTQIGIVLSVLYASSAAGQVVAGVLVDRFGAHRLLIAGVALQSLGVAAIGLATSYAALIPLAVAAGLGNSVYHPADLSILSHRVSSPRLGRGFAVHAFAGTMGFAVSPVLIGTITAFHGWRTALVTAGVLGMGVAVGLLATRAHLSTQSKQGAARRQDGDDAPARATFAQIVATPVVVLAFGYFVLSSFAGAGIQSFAITALNEGYGATLAIATLAVTAYQLGSAAGILVGGYLADRTERHHRVAMAGLAIAAVLILCATNTALPPAAIVALLTGAGFAGGATAPSRDILVRRAAPQGGMGKVFGFVYSGFDVGNLIAPLAYGAILDHHAPSLVFALTAALFAAGIVTVLGVGSRTRTPAAEAAR